MRSRILLPLAGAAAVAVTVAVLAGAKAGPFGSAEKSRPTTLGASSNGSKPLLAAHVHGIARHPRDGRVYVATHDGLHVLSASGVPSRVGPVIDLMGFTITEQGRLLASGHPGAGSDLPQPVGLIESADGGASWRVLSRGGESDFHALSESSAGMVGYDGILRSSTDGRTWRTLPTPDGVMSLGASADGSTLLATTGTGLLSSSTSGTTWDRVPGAPALVLVDWAGAARVVGVDRVGTVFVSDDAGRTWERTTARPLGPPQAIGASVVAEGLEILAVTHSGVVRSADGGATFTDLG